MATSESTDEITSSCGILNLMDDFSPPSQQPAPETNDNWPVIPPPQKRHNSRWLWLAAVIVLVIVAAGVVYVFALHRSSPASSQRINSGKSSQPVVPSAPPGNTTANTYKSNGQDLNLSFSYPAGWTITPPSGDNANDQPITITSPLVSLGSADGESTTGRVVVTIRPGGATISELADNSATAAQASAQIAYSKPTSAQHQYPYLSFVHVNSAPNPSGAFEEVFITGITSFAKGQSVYATSLYNLDPIISARFYSCSDQTCAISNAKPLGITAGTWASNDACQQTLALFESLQIS